jgi:uncharacterized protein (DUF433 family)
MTLEPLTVPLREDAGGTLRVGNTRVPLETVWRAWNQGADEIVLHYSSLELADVHAVLAYALRNRDAIEAYMQRVELEERAALALVDAMRPNDGLRERLRLAGRNRLFSTHS